MNSAKLRRRLKWMTPIQKEKCLERITDRYLERSSETRRINLVQLASHMLNDASLYEEIMSEDLKNGDYRQLCRDAKYFLGHLGEGKDDELKDVKEMKKGLNALQIMKEQLGNVVIDKKIVDEAYNTFKKNLPIIFGELTKFLWRNESYY